MAQMLVDDFRGDPKRFFGLVREEALKREIPNVRFDEKVEVVSKGFFGGTKDSALYLSVNDEINEVRVVAYQYGRGFHVTTRPYWLHGGYADMEKQGTLNYFIELRSSCFTEAVTRAVQDALRSYLEANQKPIPPALDPKQVFFSRDVPKGT